MKRIAQAFLLAALVLFAGPSCSPFTTCVRPYTSQLSWTGTVTELGDVVGAFLLCDPTFNGGDAPVCALESLNQLEVTLGPDGKAIVDCLVAYFETNGTPKQNAAAKAVGLKRGVNRSAFCPALEKISKAEGGNTSRMSAVAISVRESVPASPRASVALGDSASPAKPASARPSALECDSHCGAPMSGLVTPTACLCQRKVDGKLRWVPLASAVAAR